MRSASSTSRSGSPEVRRTTDMGHLTMPASTSSKPVKVKGVSTGAFPMAKVYRPPWKWSWARMDPPTMGRSALEPTK